MLTEYLAFILLGFVTSIASAVVGFGSALLILAIGPYFLPVKEVIALSALLFTASTLGKAVIFRRDIDWKMVGIISVISFPFAYLGGSLVADLPVPLLQRLLGAMILVYVLLKLFGKHHQIKMNTAILYLGAMTYGFVSGLLGSGNLVKAIFFSEMNLSKESFVGTMAATSVLANLAKLIAYTQSGLIDRDVLFPGLGLVTVAILAVLIGRYVMKHVSVRQFGLGIQIVLIFSALGLIV